MENFKQKLKEGVAKLSDYQIYFFSLSTGICLSLYYLKNKSVYMEHHGHYNSPNNMLNKQSTGFHLKDAGMRLALGSLFVYFILATCRDSLNPIQINQPQVVNKSWTKANNKRIEIGDEELPEGIEKEKFDNSNIIESKQKLNKYIK